MNTIIILSSTLFTTALASFALFLVSTFNSDLEKDGVACNRCMGTGLSIGKALARDCPRGCSENRESPYWPLVSAYVR